MKLLVGLGNPGLFYRNTRHNIGFMFVDELINDMKQKFKLDKAMKCEIATFTINDEKIIVIKPQTFMNLSGVAVLNVSRFYKIEAEDIIIIYDDLDLPEGKIRIRSNGSSGGHKGMQSIMGILNTEEIKRIRIGIGKNSNIETSDYVLGKLSKEEAITFSLTASKAKEMVEFLVTHSFVDFMGRYN